MEILSERIAAAVRAIPRGRVATYGQIAAFAGAPGASRRVAWLLHSSSRTRRLPWHRVINSSGGISLPRGGGYELQRSLLESEHVTFRDGRVDLRRYLWKPRPRARPDSESQRGRPGVVPRCRRRH